MKGFNDFETTQASITLSDPLHRESTSKTSKDALWVPGQQELCNVLGAMLKSENSTKGILYCHTK